MKKALLLLALVVSSQAFSAVNLDVNSKTLNPEITKYLAKKLESCSLGLGNEVFKIERVRASEIRVDNGITDLYYTIDVSYDAFRNDVISNSITVEILDADFDNWKEYEEKLSFEITHDDNKFCK